MTRFYQNPDLSIDVERPRRSRRWREIVSAATLLGFSIAAGSCSLGDNEQPLSVPVRKLIVAQPGAAMEAMAEATDSAPAATPAARMPQYQLHLRDLSTPINPEISELRFVLATPEGPMLIEAEILIDGQAYQLAREQRVQEIMRFLADPESYKAEMARQQAEVAAAAAAAAALDSAKSSLLETIRDLVIGDNTETPDAPDSAPNTSDSPPDVSEPAEKAEETDKAENLPEPERLNEDQEASDPEASLEKVTPAEPPQSSEEKNSDPEVPEAEKVPEVPAAPRYSAPATLIERIERYSQSIGDKPTIEEVRWLMSEWIDGPVLLFLNDNFQRFRADQQPVFQVLDRDRDGSISVTELEQCVVSFQECDADRNDVVDATELSERANGMSEQVRESTHGKLIYRLPPDHEAAAFLKRITERYAHQQTTDDAAGGGATVRFDKNLDGALNPEELQALREGPADIQLKLEMNTVTPDASRVTMTGFSEEFSRLADQATRNPTSITLGFKSFYLEFLAAQGNSPGVQNGGDQISVGAVDDGYAMLQEIDPNSDGRFTIRELRQLKDRLKAFDSTADGQIGFNEIHPTIRVCIGLGPTAHEPLALLREVSSSSTTDTLPGPDWFTEMDKNKDYDLTRQEFPGTDDQFLQLDKDQDGLVSSEEASLSGG